MSKTTPPRKRIKPRLIRAHKGGRTARVPSGRITPADLAALEAILSARGVSFADWLADKIAEDAARYKSAA